jgi:hypothetical protein
MSTFPNMKLFRKLLVLAVLLTGVFILSSGNKTSARTCCDTCETAYTVCQMNCHDLTKPEGYAACVIWNCDPEYNNCSNNCSFC